MFTTAFVSIFLAPHWNILIELIKHDDNSVEGYRNLLLKEIKDTILVKYIK